MKKWATILLFLVPGLSLAQANKEGVERVKAEMLSNMDQRIAIIQEAKSCVQAAGTHEALRACHQAREAKIDQLKTQNQAKRKQFKEERKQMRDERKQQRQNRRPTPPSDGSEV
jgi:Skp family chaperone for outer membrane proteins